MNSYNMPDSAALNCLSYFILSSVPVPDKYPDNFRGIPKRAGELDIVWTVSNINSYRIESYLGPRREYAYCFNYATITFIYFLHRCLIITQMDLRAVHVYRLPWR